MPSIDQDIRHVKASSVQPEALQIPGSPASTSSNSSCSSASSDNLLPEIKKDDGAMQAEINSNTRAIRQLEKAVKVHGEIMKSIKTTLDTFLSYTCSYNREERDDDRKNEREVDTKKLETMERDRRNGNKRLEVIIGKGSESKRKRQ